VWEDSIIGLKREGSALYALAGMDLVVVGGIGRLNMTRHCAGMCCLSIGRKARFALPLAPIPLLCWGKLVAHSMSTQIGFYRE
jgi:hypothetical protein